LNIWEESRIPAMLLAFSSKGEEIEWHSMDLAFLWEIGTGSNVNEARKAWWGTGMKVSHDIRLPQSQFVGHLKINPYIF
jgi:hypothetical protein